MIRILAPHASRQTLSRGRRTSSLPTARREPSDVPNLRERVRHWMETDIECLGAKALRAAVVDDEEIRRAFELAEGYAPAAPADATTVADAAPVELLKPAEEVLHFRAMNLLKLRARRLQRRLSLDRPSRAAVDAIERCVDGALRLRNRIVRANVRLVVSVAKQFANRLSTLPELVSDGNLTLMKAVAKFDFSRGFRFSTYATWALRYHFSRAVARPFGRVVGVPVGDDERMLEVADPHVLDAPREALRGQWVRAVDRMLDRLDPRERKIVTLRFGLDAGVPERSLKEIADEMGICKERVRQLQMRAVEKLRNFASAARREPLDFDE